MFVVPDSAQLSVVKLHVLSFFETVDGSSRTDGLMLLLMIGHSLWEIFENGEIFENVNLCALSHSRLS